MLTASLIMPHFSGDQIKYDNRLFPQKQQRERESEKERKKQGRFDYQKIRNIKQHKYWRLATLLLKGPVTFCKNRQKH